MPQEEVEMANAYKGEVQVEDNDFDFEFTRFIVRDHEIAFEVKGEDGDGEFTTESVAQKTEQRNFIFNVTVIYPGFRMYNPHQQDKTWKGAATITLNQVIESNNKLNCKVKGIWSQDGEEWNFNADLVEFKA